MTFRRLVEYLSRGVVLRRRLPARFGRLPIYVTPEAGLRYWLAMSRVDPVLYGMAEELVKPSSVVWDVGANVGRGRLEEGADRGLQVRWIRGLLPFFEDVTARSFPGAVGRLS